MTNMSAEDQLAQIRSLLGLETRDEAGAQQNDDTEEPVDISLDTSITAQSQEEDRGTPTKVSNIETPSATDVRNWWRIDPQRLSTSQGLWEVRLGSDDHSYAEEPNVIPHRSNLQRRGLRCWHADGVHSKTRQPCVSRHVGAPIP